ASTKPRARRAYSAAARIQIREASSAFPPPDGSTTRSRNPFCSASLSDCFRSDFFWQEKPAKRITAQAARISERATLTTDGCSACVQLRACRTCDFVARCAVRPILPIANAATEEKIDAVLAARAALFLRRARPLYVARDARIPSRQASPRL